MLTFKRISLIAGLLTASTLAMPQAWSQQDELERAKAMREEAKALRDQAEQIYAAEMPECYHRFLVNHCLGKVKAARLNRVRQARTLDIEAGRLELADKQRQAVEEGREVADRPGDHSIPAPAVIGERGDEFEQRAEEVRRQREIEAARAEAEAGQVQAQRDAERAASRAETEQAAADRVAKAQRDRERYEERLRKAEERLKEKAEE